jgi:hypothetical protein
MDPFTVAIALLNTAIGGMLFKDATRRQRIAPFWGGVGLIFGFFGAVFYFSLDSIQSHLA